MNNLFVSGILGRDPEITEINGKKLVKFSIADKINKDTTQWLNCEAWENTAENIAKFFKKGDKIIIIGQLLIQEYQKDGEKKSITKVRINQFDFANGRREQAGNDSATAQVMTTQPTVIQNVQEIKADLFQNNNDDVPF